MIETIEEAQALLRQHAKFCQLLACNECDERSDVSDLLTIVRRLLNGALMPTRGQRRERPLVEFQREWIDEADALLARAPTNEVVVEESPLESDP